jgi:ATP-dependent exoDNAse (exonuclease V) alpha subunit
MKVKFGRNPLAVMRKWSFVKAPDFKGISAKRTILNKSCGNPYNGKVGTITGIYAETGMIRARLDAAAGQPGREVVWSASEFAGFRHGYAGTIYKGQVRTLDHT